MMKREQRDADASMQRALIRRSCTPYDAAAAAASSYSTSSLSESTPSLKEMAVDLRLMKHSMMEVQDSVRDLFDKVQGILQGLSANSGSLLRNGSLSGREAGSVSGEQQSQRVVATTLLKYNIRCIVVNLPFSQRPCETSNVPPSSTKSLIFLPFVTTLQRMQKVGKSASIEVNELDQEIQKSDPIFMERTGAKRFRDYIVLAQQFLDINIDDVDIKDKKWRVYFQDVDKPWLVTSRESVPIWEDQEQEMILFRKVPMAAAERYMPLLEALLSSKKGRSMMELRRHPSVKEYTSLTALSEMHWSRYCQDAAKLCKIQMEGNSNAGYKIRLLDNKNPFYTQRFNQHFFPRNDEGHAPGKKAPKKKLRAKAREEMGQAAKKRISSKKLRASTPFKSSIARSQR